MRAHVVLLFQIILLSLSFSPMPAISSENMNNTTPIPVFLQKFLSDICPNQVISSPILSTEPIVSRQRNVGIKTTYQINSLDRLLVEQIKPSDKTLSYRLTYFKNKTQAVFFIATDSDCNIRLARKISYENESAVMLHILDTDLSSTIRQEAIKPDVPIGTDFEGVRVGLIDSGINYLIPELAKHLARDSDGKLIGYDFWSMDAKPFDYNPARSIFFPQRHGTKTASLLINEAPNVSLVPYRYPRHNMQRMHDLIQHAADHKVSIIAMPLGSNNKEEWQSFYQSAKEHPNILFIVSSGNNGVNIDLKPIYPASFDLDNLLVVSSANEIPAPAPRTNWGSNSVNVLVPSERLKTINFNAKSTLVSGTSYAVSRIAALAARIKSKNDSMSAQQLKNKILHYSDPNRASQYSSHGLLADPLIDTASIKIMQPPVSIRQNNKEHSELTLKVNIMLLEKSGWTKKSAKYAADQAISIYKACNINLDFTLNFISVNDYLLNFHSLTSRTLSEKLALKKPSIYLVKDTLRTEPFEAEAFGIKNTRRLPWLQNTAWLIADIQHPGIALAHELAHILVDNGDHNEEPDNLMNETTMPNHTQLNTRQCLKIKQSKLLIKQ